MIAIYKVRDDIFEDFLLMREEDIIECDYGKDENIYTEPYEFISGFGINIGIRVGRENLKASTAEATTRTFRYIFRNHYFVNPEEALNYRERLITKSKNDTNPKTNKIYRMYKKIKNVVENGYWGSQLSCFYSILMLEEFNNDKELMECVRVVKINE